LTENDLLNELTSRYPALTSCKDDVLRACNAIADSFSNQGRLLACGNGGSSADADHMVAELMKSFEKPRPINKDLKDGLKSVSRERGGFIGDNLQEALPAISLNAHNALISAISNDMDASLAFAQQVVGYGRPGDLLIAISTSGNAQNVIDAAITAKARGLTVVGLTGQHGGNLKQYCHIAICVPATRTPDVQEFHLPIYHALCKMVESRFF
jgi:D-sedoheptulose 7-phosphate isomerase